MSSIFGVNPGNVSGGEHFWSQPRSSYYLACVCVCVVTVLCRSHFGDSMPRVGCEYRYVFRNAAGRFYVQAHGWTSRSLPTAHAAALVLCKKLKIPREALRKVS